MRARLAAAALAALALLALLAASGAGGPEPRAAAQGAAAPDGRTPEQRTPAQLAGQRIVFGFNGTEAPRSLLRRIRRGEAAGVILFARNIRSRAQVRRLTGSLQRWRPPGDPPLIVSVDQEGGIVKRLAGAPRRSAAELGRAGSPRLAYDEGRNTARNLRGVGVNVNFAPVVDIGRPGRIMRAQGRAFSSSPARVTRLAAAFADGLRDGGVIPCAKHFPGLGGARHDQDRRNNAIALSAERLRAEDYAPYEHMAEQRLEMVMTSTADYPALDPDRPAVFSQRILVGELRERVGFSGVTVTDSLGTQSATRLGSPEARAVRAARAGNDLLLFASDYRAGVRGAEALAERDPAPEATARVDALRQGL
ncbi:MAG TPA: glycoside hydrolase family 3 N-terminal domain-containing protein [Thermoleophilaceae bacterium]